MRAHLACLAALAALGPACADGGAADKDPDAPAPALAAKADGFDADAAFAGALPFDEAVEGELTAERTYETWTFSARAGATLDVEITRRGTSRGLDTVIWVLGPLDSPQALGDVVAYDDDSGWSLLSHIEEFVAPDAGDYRVFVSSYTHTQTGRYQLIARCPGGDCAPADPVASGYDERYCHPRLVAAIDDCVDDVVGDPEYDPEAWGVVELARACVDPEPMAPHLDAICAERAPTPDFCERELEAYLRVPAELCTEHAFAAAGQRTCLFGDSWHALQQGPPGVTITGWRTLSDGPDALSDTERAQLVVAMELASFGDVANAAEAFELADGGEIHVVQIWDETHKAPYVAFEFALGDTSVGAVFPFEGLDPAAVISDLDFIDCAVAPGPGYALCQDDGDCQQAETCRGYRPAAGAGRCVSNAFRPGEGAMCSDDDPCAAGSGLLCAGSGTSPDGSGLCLPASFLGRFIDYAAAPIPSADPEGLTRVIEAFGLTTVPMDVRVRLRIDHPRPEELRVTLTNPDTTEAVVVDRAEGEGDFGVELDAFVSDFPGDESANGAWTLRVVDDEGPAAGTLVSWELILMTRWD